MVPRADFGGIPEIDPSVREYLLVPVEAAFRVRRRQIEDLPENEDRESGHPGGASSGSACRPPRYLADDPGTREQSIEDENTGENRRDQCEGREPVLTENEHPVLVHHADDPEQRQSEQEQDEGAAV